MPQIDLIAPLLLLSWTDHERTADADSDRNRDTKTKSPAREEDSNERQGSELEDG
jgi:hypothetical protein